MTNVMIIENMVDECGITRELTTDERHFVGKQLGSFYKVADLAAGDLINQETKALGLGALTLWAATHDQIQEYLVLSPLLSELGFTLSTAANHATLARSFNYKDRCAGMGLAHYRAVQGLDRSLSKTILQEAQMGYQKPNGDWVKPHPASWVKAKRKALEGSHKAKAKVIASAIPTAVVNEAIPEVSKTLNSMKLPPAKQATIERRIEKALKKEVKHLEIGFSAAVDDEVAKQVKKEREKLRKLNSQAAQDAKWNRERREGMRTTVTEAEFKTLRLFCHPDKHPGNEAKARKAFDIALKIGEKLGFTE